MGKSSRGQTAVQTIAMLGNHLPRHCGIATFTTDLSAAISLSMPALDCFVVAMNDVGTHHAYPPRVRFEIPQGDIEAYRRAADFLNVNSVDVVSVQHEYGIFGGKAGGHVLELLRALRMPVVTTLHTILERPDPVQRAVLEALVSLSERVVVRKIKGAGFKSEATKSLALRPFSVLISGASKARRRRYWRVVVAKPKSISTKRVSPSTVRSTKAL